MVRPTEMTTEYAPSTRSSADADLPFDVGGIGSCNQVDEDFRVAARRENGAIANELGANLVGVHDVAVVRDRQWTRVVVHEVRLGVGEHGAAGGRIPGVSDRDVAGETRKGRLIEAIGNESHHPVDPGPISLVDRDDARTLLAAVLQRIEAEVGHSRSIGNP